MCNSLKSAFHIFAMFSIFDLLLKKHNSITIKSMKLNLCMWKCINMYWGIEVLYLLTLVFHVLLIVISPSNVL